MNSVTAVAFLRAARISRGDRWVYSAGFNVDSSLSSTGRIDEEIDDLAMLIRRGARVALLSHQGTHRDGSAEHLGHIARYLTLHLGRRVSYFPTGLGPAALRRAGRMRDGEIVLFGNTRFEAGEERNDLSLGRAFARLGDRIAMGGFSKLHRAHASNNAILRTRPAFLASSVERALAQLAPWTHPGGPSLAFVGGVKSEKSVVGLPNLVQRYNRVVPTGTVLNAYLAASGLDVGASKLGEHPQRAFSAAREVITGAWSGRVVLPTHVIVAGSAGARRIEVGDRVRSDEKIVDLDLPAAVLRYAGARPRVLVAGTPSAVHDGFRGSIGQLEAAFGPEHADTLLVGGDTAQDFDRSIGCVSSGGGSALTVIATGSAVTLDTMRRARGTKKRKTYAI